MMYWFVGAMGFLFTGCPKSYSYGKRPNDRRVYAAFVLENGMEALVISDPETDVAATSLRVRVGSFSDPWDRQGLAHFLEHMLLISSVLTTET